MELTLAIYYYDVGDHPAGFIGWRVVVSMGIDGDLTQRYFSDRQYGYLKGKRLAEEADRKLRLQAEAIKIKRGVPTGRDGKRISYLFAKGFLFHVSKQNGGWFITYRYSAKVNGRSISRSVSLQQGVQTGFYRALDLYAELRGLSDDEYYEIWKKCPATHELVDHVRDYLPQIYPDIPVDTLVKRLIEYGKLDIL